MPGILKTVTVYVVMRCSGMGADAHHLGMEQFNLNPSVLLLSTGDAAVFGIVVVRPDSPRVWLLDRAVVQPTLVYSALLEDVVPVCQVLHLGDLSL